MKLAPQPIRRNLRAKPTLRTLAGTYRSLNPNSSDLDSAMQNATPVSTFRMNTCKSVSKQRALTTFRINTYGKRGRGARRSSLRTCGRCCEILPWFSLRRRLRCPAHHAETNILRRSRAIRLRVRRAIRAAADHFAFALARQHPFSHVAAQIKN